MNDATCKTCLWWDAYMVNPVHPQEQGRCRACSPNRGDGWYNTDATDWCGEHPDRQPHLEGLSTTLVGRETFPTESDARRIVDALEQMARMAVRGAS